jgi:hypothetical protein
MEACPDEIRIRPGSCSQGGFEIKDPLFGPSGNSGKMIERELVNVFEVSQVFFGSRQFRAVDDHGEIPEVFAEAGGRGRGPSALSVRSLPFRVSSAGSAAFVTRGASRT